MGFGFEFRPKLKPKAPKKQNLKHKSKPDAQVLLVNAVKDVASALTDLISAIKITSSEGEMEAASGEEMSQKW